MLSQEFKTVHEFNGARRKAFSPEFLNRFEFLGKFFKPLKGRKSQVSEGHSREFRSCFPKNSKRFINSMGSRRGEEAEVGRFSTRPPPPHVGGYRLRLVMMMG